MPAELHVDGLCVVNENPNYLYQVLLKRWTDAKVVLRFGFTAAEPDLYVPLEGLMTCVPYDEDLGNLRPVSDEHLISLLDVYPDQRKHFNMLLLLARCGNDG